jgi:hypothetical protein
MKKKRKSRFTDEDWARSDRVREMLLERIAYHEQRLKEREENEKR